MTMGLSLCLAKTTPMTEIAKYGRSLPRTFTVSYFAGRAYRTGSSRGLMDDGISLATGVKKHGH